MAKLWIVEYGRYEWEGGSSYVVVHAETAVEAEEKAAEFMAQAMGGNYLIYSTEEFDEAHEHWVFFISQDENTFYPVIR